MKKQRMKRLQVVVGLMLVVPITLFRIWCLCTYDQRAHENFVSEFGLEAETK